VGYPDAFILIPTYPALWFSISLYVFGLSAIRGFLENLPDMHHIVAEKIIVNFPQMYKNSSNDLNRVD